MRFTKVAPVCKDVECAKARNASAQLGKSVK